MYINKEVSELNKYFDTDSSISIVDRMSERDVNFEKKKKRHQDIPTSPELNDSGDDYPSSKITSYNDFFDLGANSNKSSSVASKPEGSMEVQPNNIEEIKEKESVKSNKSKTTSFKTAQNKEEEGSKISSSISPDSDDDNNDQAEPSSEKKEGAEPSISSSSEVSA